MEESAGVAASGSCLAYVTSPSRPASVPVLVTHSWWGLTTSFTAYADALAGAGFLAACVDLFDGRVAVTEAEARALRRERRREPAYRTLQRALRELASISDGQSPAVAGFSMGGHWAIWLAQHPDPPVSAVVLYYAARGGDFSAATAPVLAHYADADRFVSPGGRRTMERALSARGRSYQAHDYPGTAHWFAESDSAAFDAGAASRAFDRTTRFLRRVNGPD
jgi:carboxymethylenebutenolidase